MTRRATWTVADIARLLKGAARSGQRVVVEAAPDGKIRIIASDETSTPATKSREINAL